MKTNRWFAKYETGSDRFGEQVSRIEFRGFDNLEEAEAFCEKNARDVERVLHGQ
jgi:viroplasmin and RNaseH domain-containing protein